MHPGEATPTLRKWGRGWRIGTDSDVRWIKDFTAPGLTIASGVPPVFADYATIVVPEPNDDLPVVRHLRDHSRKQKWWLGFLETSPTDNLVFPEAPRVELYTGWPYVLVLAGPEEAMAWRDGRPFAHHHGHGPDLLFPTDRSWLLSWLWDDDWYCVGGSTDLIDSLLARQDLEVRRVSLTEDATPPGHIAY
jgi:hypothetical protein